MFYLFLNDKVINKSSNIDDLLLQIFNMNLYINTAPYCNYNLDSLQELLEFFDSHEGVWFPICDLYKKDNNEYIDVFIVEEFYSYQDKNYQNEIIKFNTK